MRVNHSARERDEIAPFAENGLAGEPKRPRYLAD